MTNQLLEPSLGSNGEIPKGLSLRSQVLIASFLGSITISLYLIFHSYHTGRLKKDWPLLLIMIGSALTLRFYAADWVMDNGLKPYASRILGVAFVGLHYLLRKDMQKFLEAHDSFRRPWLPLGVSVLGAILLNMLVSFVKKGAY